VKGTVIHQILDFKYCTDKQKLSLPREINYHSTKLYLIQLLFRQRFCVGAKSLRGAEDLKILVSFAKLATKLPGVFGKLAFLSIIVTPQHFPTRFPCMGVSFRRIKICTPPRNLNSPFAYFRVEYHRFLRLVLLPRLNSIGLCVIYFEGVRCYTRPAQLGKHEVPIYRHRFKAGCKSLFHFDVESSL